MPDALAETVRAWDRSGIGTNEESVLWDLDRQLGIEDPFSGLSGVQLGAARSRSPYPLASGWACVGGYAGCAAGGGGTAGCSGGGGGDSGGGGCGGGGCGGGGGGS